MTDIHSEESYSPDFTINSRRDENKEQEDHLKRRFERSETSSGPKSPRGSSSTSPRHSHDMRYASYTDKSYVEPLEPAAARPAVVLVGRDVGRQAAEFVRHMRLSKANSNASRVTPSSLQDAEGNDRASKEKASYHASSNFVIAPELSQKIDENAEVAEDDEDNRSDCASSDDETTSIQSYSESVFDSGSVGSSMSSISSTSNTQALVGEYVDFLVRDPGLEKLFMRSMLPTVLGSDRFRQNYSRILQSYARDLDRQLSSLNEPKMPLRTQGLAFISRRSITMKTASIIASRYMETAPRTQFYPGRTECDNEEVLSEEETSSGDESPVNESNQNFMISELGQYFREGAPFQRMKRNLRNLVIPITGLSRVKASTERMLDLVLRDDYLRFLLFKALSDPLVPLRDDPFDPETGIRYFGSSLKAEANSPDHVRLAEFIETYAGYIGTRAVQRMENMDMEEILQDSQVSASILCFRVQSSSPAYLEYLLTGR